MSFCQNNARWFSTLTFHKAGVNRKCDLWPFFFFAQSLYIRGLQIYCPAAFWCILTRTHLYQINGPLPGHCQTWRGNSNNWFSCVGAGDVSKGCGAAALRDRSRESWFGHRLFCWETDDNSFSVFCQSSSIFYLKCPAVSKSSWFPPHF